MRPNKFRSEVTKAIEYRLNTGSNAKFTPYLIKAMKDMCDKWQIEEDDFRTGDETYGYEDTESITTNLFYISDRWRAAFRLKWIIEGLERGVI